MMITRRAFVRFLAGLPLLSFPFRIAAVSAQPSQPSRRGPKGSIAESFAGEALHYEIGFWVLKKVAAAKLTFLPADQKGRYVATLVGETQGLIGWLVRYRTDSYRAVMEEVDGGTRLRSLSFEEQVKVGKKTRKHAHTFDHQKRVWVHLTTRRNRTIERVETEIPEGKTYDDFLTASYNFRYGVYGTVERGKTFSVPTFPRKGANTYDVKIAPRDEEERKRASDKVPDGEYLISLWLDPEIINSTEGNIEGWLSKDLYPVDGVIKDVVLFGDVHGQLVKKERGV